MNELWRNTEGRVNYHEYINSQEWRRRRRATVPCSNAAKNTQVLHAKSFAEISKAIHRPPSRQANRAHAQCDA